MKRLSVFVAVVLAVLVATFWSKSPFAAEPQPKVIRFTAIPDNDETMLRERMRPLAEHLSAKLGVKFEYFHVADYAASVKALQNGDAFLGWFGGLTGVQVRARTNGQAIAQGEEDKAFYSYLVAHKSTGLKEGTDKFPEDIKGKKFTFGSESSTSGRLMPEFYIRQHFKKAPKEIFSDVGFSGSHSITLRLVNAGTWEVGAVNGKDWEIAKEKGDVNDSVAIWKTPTYADYNWTVRGDIDKVYGDGFTKKIQDTLLAIDPAQNEEQAAIMKAFTRKRFIAASNSDYKAIEDTAKELGLLR